MLGPHKVAGPDGFNSKLLQDQWGVFGPAIIQEVNQFFSTGRMGKGVSRSNLILVPKIEDLTRVGDFRPISVCNVLYKIVSKLLERRLKPFISGLISPSQSAFVPGREIAENVLLLREILHSFNSKNYSNSEFCLKVDLSKDFDRMDWGYLEIILPLYGFPPNMENWVMGCVRSAQFTIILNGGGDGVIMPKCGLR